MKKLLFRTVLVTALYGLSSCSTDLDFDQASDINFEFGVNAPILDATIGLKQIIDSNEYIIVEGDGGLKINLREDDIFEFGLADFTEVQDQDLFQEDILIGNANIPLTAEMDNVGNFLVSAFTFESGKFIFKAVSPVSDPIELTIHIKNGTNNGGPAIFSFTTTGLETTKSFDLINFNMDFTGTAGTNNLDIEFSSTAPSGIPIGSTLELGCRAENIELLSVEGDFGNLSIDIPEDTFRMDLDGLDKLVDGLIFTNPKFNMIVENGFGFGLGMNIDMKGENSHGIESNLSADELILGSPNVQGNIHNQTLTIDKNNSNLPDFLSGLPQKMTYSGDVSLNPGSGPNNNFMHKSSFCKGSIEIDIPLEVQLQDLVYETIIEDVEVLDNDSDEIEQVELIFQTKNLFPFDANFKMFMMNDANADIDSIPMDLLKAAPVDANGISTEPTVHEFSVILDQSNINNLKLTKALKFKGHLTSTNNGSVPVKIIDSYNIGIKMAVKGNGSVNNSSNN